MENLQYGKILRKNWELVALFTGLAVIIALIISLVSPFQYSATTKILIIQKQEQNLDAYTATKSAERIGKNLASIIDTSSFYNDVIESNSFISGKFSTDATERRKAWEKNIKADVIPESGILEIEAYDVDRNFASQIVKTIAYVLVNRGSEYHGGGADVEIKVVDDVFLSKYPVRPNIILNLILALIIGILFGSYFVILNEARKIRNSREIKTYQPLKARDEDSDMYQINEMDWEPTAKTIGFDADLKDNRDTRIISMHDHLK
jgi:capsular polysaccharide biosynthesis protein